MSYIEILKSNEHKFKNAFFPRQGRAINLVAHENKTLIESGENLELFKLILEYVNCARESIFLQSFLIQDTPIVDALVEASRRNVKVFVMDSEIRLGEQLEEDESFMVGEYKAMLERKFKNRIIHRLADDLHAKYILTDPKTDPKGVLFTGNFNMKPFQENPEIGVILNDQQVETLHKLFAYHFWEYCDFEQTESKEFKAIKPLGRFLPFDTKDVLLTSPNTDFSNLKSKLLEAILQAQESICFSTFGFDINHSLSQAIMTKLNSGVDVTVYCRPREKAIVNHIEKLEAMGAKVICHQLIHAKSLLVDNCTGFVFTANFETNGMDKGFEVGVRLNKEQVVELKRIHDKWDATFPYKYKTEVSIKDVENTLSQFDEIGKLRDHFIEEQYVIEKTLHRCGEIIKVFDNPIKSRYYKSELYKLNFKTIENKEYNVSQNLAKGVDEISISLRKNKTESAILINTSQMSITSNIIDRLRKQNTDMKVYSL